MRMWTQFLGTMGVVSSWDTLSRCPESTDMLSREDAELCECLEPEGLSFLSLFFVAIHMVPAKRLAHTNTRRAK
jgi:hypothetical protein